MDSSQLNLDEIVGELQVIKCVVVGDTGVGKTRLICAHAFGTKYSLQQLSQTHVPTVWAIDQYRKNAQALSRSWCNIDGISVSLRLWDTFGDHNKDRRFAYGRADVILVCYSVVQPRSLQHVWNHWHPEIQRFCPRVPIILCGCQVDMRYLYKDPRFLGLDKGPFFKEILDDDILLPEAGRTVAQQIGAYYYETSVLEQFGIDSLFTNIARAAFIYKRDCHFWNNFGLLKNISKPSFQAPHLPPQQPQPEVIIPSDETDDDVLMELLQNETFCDVLFLVQKVPIPAHKVCLIAASSIFDALFWPDHDEPSSLLQLCYLNDTSGVTNVAMSVETLNDAGQQESGRFSESELHGQRTINSAVNQIFKLVQSPFEQKSSGFGSRSGLTVVSVDNSVSVMTFNAIMKFFYTGKLSASDQLLDDIRRVGALLDLTEVVGAVDNIQNKQEFCNQEILANFQSHRRRRLIDVIISKGIISDVEFQLDDGHVMAHRVLLAAGSDVMASMFSSNFMEGSAKVISYPGITAETFRVLQTFLYTSQCSDLCNANRLELIELANRLCLPRLLACAEQSIVRELKTAEKSSQDIAEEVLTYLEPAQLHNAAQLANWCLWYLSINYIDIYRRFCKLLHGLRPDNQIYLTTHRYPPLWYLKESDVYEKSVLEVQREKTVRRYSGRQTNDVDMCGCLCFTVLRSCSR